MNQPPQPRTGLRVGALDLGRVLVIGIASAAPGYSLAAALGLVTVSAGVHMPAMLLLAFLPMACVATAFDQFNRIDPDCGTSFAWVTRAFGPSAGWLTGWAIIAADIVVMASLAQISAQYSLAFFGLSATAHPQLSIAIGIMWLAATTWICFRGITFSANLQAFLLVLELAVLLTLAALMLHAVYFAPTPAGVRPALAWFTTSGLSPRAWMDAMGIAIFLYWGWDSALNVNEETQDARRTPGRAALLSTLALVGIFVVTGTAALSWAGPGFLISHQDDVLSALAAQVLGRPWDKLLHAVVLTSAIAATQTTILPTARTVLSMAQKGALPEGFATIHPVHQIPSRATLWMGVISVVWYVALTQATTAVVAASLQALNLLVAFYYGLTGIACAWHFRRDARTVRTFALRIVAPLLGGLSLFAMLIGLILWPSSDDSADKVLPVALALALMGVGTLLMLAHRAHQSRFWRTRAAADD